jgi:hypothetical protein
MPWEVLLIVLVVVGVIILATVFTNANEQPKNRQPPRDLRPRTQNRRPMSDLDRFLEEARRRREGREASEPRPRPAPVVAPVPAPPRPAAPPRERPVRTVPDRPAPPAKSAPAPRPAVPRPATPPVVVEPIPVFQVVPEMEARRLETVAPSTAANARATAGATDDRRPSATLAQIVTLLASPRTAAAAAFVLGEVFNKPLSLRGPRREA